MDRFVALVQVLAATVFVDGAEMRLVCSRYRWSCCFVSLHFQTADLVVVAAAAAEAGAAGAVVAVVAVVAALHYHPSTSTHSTLWSSWPSASSHHPPALQTVSSAVSCSL